VLEKERGLEVEIVPGGTGEFTVMVGDQKLWDKHETGRFPDDSEILAMVV
jgi:selT/selW/selH-like putative selenoprotein